MMLRNNFYDQFLKIWWHPPVICQVSLKNYYSCLTVDY